MKGFKEMLTRNGCPQDLMERVIALLQREMEQGNFGRTPQEMQDVLETLKYVDKL